MSNVDKRVAVVTGAARGLGSEITKGLLTAGFQVAGFARNIEPLPQDPSFHPVMVDVRNEAQVLAGFQKTMERFGRIDVLINNAGTGTFRSLVETTLEDWSSTIETNLTGAFLCAREAMRKMKGGGRIINIGSIADHVALPNNGAYAASKFGLRGLNGVINEEGKALGINATLVSLGATYTDIWKSRPEFSRADMLKPEEVATFIIQIATQPDGFRMDEVKLLPPKGIL